MKEKADTERLLKELLERLTVIEGMLEMLREDVEELKRSRAGGRRGVGFSRGLIKTVENSVYIPTSEVRARGLLRRLVEGGKLILLRDDVANVEIVTTPSNVKKIADRLPIAVNDVVKVFNEREYELLSILNRLGYVLIRDGKYVATDLMSELVGV